MLIYPKEVTDMEDTWVCKQSVLELWCLPRPQREVLNRKLPEPEVIWKEAHIQSEKLTDKMNLAGKSRRWIPWNLKDE